ncbi:hypothetical protein I79_000776 [Cricetulus griseus]|uniref:Uncharacterized protein n=1 Tax=Cricetulus griseus TaxID=10029 RepID=G3GT03_CRIGR|nr:hypothetical protein I79_000776 [Cricetulus griseus]
MAESNLRRRPLVPLNSVLCACKIELLDGLEIAFPHPARIQKVSSNGETFSEPGLPGWKGARLQFGPPGGSLSSRPAWSTEKEGSRTAQRNPAMQNQTME